MSARSARCSPEPNPISKWSGRSSPNRVSDVTSPSAGKSSSGSNRLDQFLLSLAQLVPARPAVETVEGERVAGLERGHRTKAASAVFRSSTRSTRSQGKKSPSGLAAEMAVGGGRLVDRLVEAKVRADAARGQSSKLVDPADRLLRSLHRRPCRCRAYRRRATAAPTTPIA